MNHSHLFSGSLLIRRGWEQKASEFSVFSKMSTVVFIFKRNYEHCHHVRLN